MSRIAYVNGRYLPRRDAAVSVEDRGYLFADGVYEVCEVRGHRLVDERRHMQRLQRSLSELRIDMPMPLKALSVVIHEVVRRNRVRDGIVYLQITRGVARRDHAFPPPGTIPSIVVTASRIDPQKTEALAAAGIDVVTLPDNRWERVDIKSISLLPNVLAKQAAREQGAREAWFVDSDGKITEGSSSNAWIVTQDNVVVTPAADHAILRGITRTVLLEALASHGLTLREDRFSVADALAAREAFITSASQTVMPVVRIDGRPVGNAQPGPLARTLRADFHRFAEKS